MAKTPVGPVYDKTVKIIDTTLEPRFKRMIEETNKLLAKMGVHIGAEIQWFIESVETDETKDKKS